MTTNFQLKTLQDKNSNVLYHSQFPQKNSHISSNSGAQMRFSLISFENNCKSQLEKSQIKAKNLNYKYKRVNNMFKLVSVDDDQYGNRNDVEVKIMGLQQQIRILSQRISEFETNDNNKDRRNDIIIEALHQEIAWLAERDREVSMKLQQRNSELRQIKERVQEIQEHIFSERSHLEKMNYEKLEINKKIRQQTEQIQQRVNKFVRAELDGLYNTLNSKNQQISKQLVEFKNQIITQIKPRQKLEQKNRHVNLFRMNKTYLLKHKESYEIVQTEKQYLVEEKIYKIDSNGVLVDNDGFRILDQNNEQVRINGQHLQKLKEYLIFCNDSHQSQESPTK